MTDDFQLSDFLPYLLNQAAEQASRDFAEVYKSRYGMQRTDWRVLAHLGEFGALSARDICNRAGEDKTRVSRAVARLEKAGIIHRATSETDRRSETLDLTIKGKRTYRDLTRLAVENDDALANSLGVKDAKTLRRLLAKIAKVEIEKQ